MQSLSCQSNLNFCVFQDLESLHSPSQNAVVLVFARSIEAETEKGHGSCLSRDFVASLRLLVNADEVTCLTENGGRVLSEMIEDTGSDIKILEDGTIYDHQASVVQVQQLLWSILMQFCLIFE